MLEGYLTNKKKVWKVMETHPATHDSDKLLWLAFLCIHHNLQGVIGKATYVKLRALIMDEDTPTMETVRRIRQKFQEEGHFRGKLWEDRHMRKEEMHEHFAEELRE